MPHSTDQPEIDAGLVCLAQNVRLLGVAADVDRLRLQRTLLAAWQPA